MKKLGLLLSSLALCTAANAADLTIYTYDSFNSDWGPGPKLAEAFEKQCECDIEFVSVDDGVSILNRLRIEGDKTKADVIVGIDDSLMELTRDMGLVAEHEQSLEGLEPALNWTDTEFAPFDYGYFSFIYDSSKIETPVSSLKELVESDAKVIYQDPRTSTVGQGLLLWMRSVYGDKADSAWKSLAQNTVTVTKGWSEAYSMFLKGESDYVLSYTTSPAYHIVAEEKTQYKAAEFSEGHTTQIELAAVLKSSKNQALAKQFVGFLMSEEAQKIIPVTNWMLPVRAGIELPEAFSTLAQPKRIGFTSEEVSEGRRDWVKEWRTSAAK
ncbi:thiamine ABC transporter substrate binding subunit [Leucothrix sargassi]|nr:thiamine ABC transporter substrate binding subunit [Leucothrix sargassi]